MGASRWRNVRRGDPCAVCGKASWCSRTDDGAWALCRRVDADGAHKVDSAGMDYWLHRFGDGPAAPPEIPQEPPAERAPAEDLDRVYRAVLRLLGLTAAHRAALVRRGLDEATIDERLFRSLPARGRAELARGILERFPERLVLAVPGFHAHESHVAGRGSYLTFGGPQGLVIPVLDLEGRVVALKIRRDRDDGEGRYLYVSSTGHGGPGPGAPVHVPRWDGAMEQVRLTEGELKADVAQYLSGIHTISVPSVSAWRGALPVLRTLRPERVLLAFDADAATNPHVALATQATVDALLAEGWEVGVETWDGTRAKGIDDALVAGLAIEVLVHVPAGSPKPSNADVGACATPTSNGCCYRATRDGLAWQRPTKDGSIDQRLTNFVARITTDVIEDDGVESRRRFEIEARMNGSRRTFSIPADAFASMGWATEHLGARAVVFPGIGLKDHSRAAVQLLSGEVAERRVFSHSGWRELDGHGWAYLHAGGAVGARGPIAGVDVALPDALARMVLPDPPRGDELVAAVGATLRLLEVAPETITVALVGAAMRAVLGPCDFALHLAGPSGAGKSELAALVQSHFGAEFDARHLPGSWSSTANALEGLAFAGKDAVLVVDDFAPTGGANDADRAHRDADRLFRAQGNRSGRLRMRQDGSLRAAKPPRGLILSTGEDLPRGQSLRARVLVLEVGPGDVDWNRLTDCQADARSGRYAAALAAFLRWNAGRYEATQRELQDLVAQLRAKASASGEHRRTPDIVANLAAGIGLFLAFAVDCGAVSEAERDELVGRCWRSLGEAARAQAAHQQPAEPARRFLELLRGAIASGRAHLAGVEGDRPEVHEESWGWRRDAYGTWEPKGERVGWLDGEHVYLEPDAAYAVVQRLGQEVGDRLPLTPQTLRRRLKEAGALASSETKRRMLTVRRTLEGQRREVLHLCKETLSPSTEDGGPGEGGDAWRSASVGDVVDAGSVPSTNGNGHLPADSLPLGNLVGVSTQERRVGE